MDILYLAHRIPFPPDKGDKLRSFHELEYLSKRHRVWCACFVDTPSDERFVDPLRALCHDVAAVRLHRAPAKLRGLAGLVRGGTLTESFYSHAGMRAALNAWCRSCKFDIVLAFSSSMARYAFQVPADRRVLDLCDVDSQKWIEYAEAARGPARWLYRIEGRRLELKERTWGNTFDATLVVTEAEAASLQGLVTPEKLHIVGNGVSLPDLGEPSDAPGDDAAPTVGFVGAMDYRPNIDAVCWFASVCWPRILAACPGVVFRIVGRSPTRRVRRLASVPGVEVVGGVEDVATEVRRFTVSVAPMRIARGIQNKVLEAMAAAKPVVLTTKAAVGIAGCREEVYLVADQPREIVERVAGLLSDPAERERLGLAGRRFVACNHCWEETLRKFELIVTGATEQTAGRSTPWQEADALAVDESTVAAPV